MIWALLVKHSLSLKKSHPEKRSFHIIVGAQRADQCDRIGNENEE